MDNIFGLVRDLAVIGYLFVLRIGVVIWITLMLGWWLKKLLEEKEEAPQPNQAPTAETPATQA